MITKKRKSSFNDIKKTITDTKSDISPLMSSLGRVFSNALCIAILIYEFNKRVEHLAFGKFIFYCLVVLSVLYIARLFNDVFHVEGSFYERLDSQLSKYNPVDKEAFIALQTTVRGQNGFVPDECLDVWAKVEEEAMKKALDEQMKSAPQFRKREM
ncbi:hypothetical protein D3C87_347910 [compost metagenome]